MKARKVLTDHQNAVFPPPQNTEKEVFVTEMALVND
jgi:hypothetical protein